VLAVSVEWNTFAELWAMDVPCGEKITWLVSRATPQPYRQKDSASDPRRRMLIGHATQVYFPVKNALWIRRHSSLR
jgi:hypothetical protein